MNKVLIDRSVVEQALEALNASMPHNNDMDEDWPSHIAARRALRAALEQPQPKREPIPSVMMDLGWELHGSNDAYQTWCMAVEWTELCHGIGGKK